MACLSFSRHEPAEPLAKQLNIRQAQIDIKGEEIKTCPRKQAVQYPGRAGKHNLARGGGSRYQKDTAMC